MEKTIEVLNEMVSAGVIAQYAIGGAVGLLFYTEPSTTYDLDVFCLLPPSAALITPLSEIYQYLGNLGWNPDNEHIIIAGVPVQFLLAFDDLTTEAVEQAETKKFMNTSTRVFKYEHLLAIMARTGRAKDKIRLLESIERNQPDPKLLKQILERHQLTSKWSIIMSYGK